MYVSTVSAVVHGGALCRSVSGINLLYVAVYIFVIMRDGILLREPVHRPHCIHEYPPGFRTSRYIVESRCKLAKLVNSIGETQNIDDGLTVTSVFILLRLPDKLSIFSIGSSKCPNFRHILDKIKFKGFIGGPNSES